MNWNGNRGMGPIGRTGFCLALFFLPLGLHGQTTDRIASGSKDDPWKRNIELVRCGEFDAAAEAADHVLDGGPLNDQLRAWLAEYQTKQRARKALDLEEFNRYVEYAQARRQREEFAQALDWAWRAADVAEDRDTFLKTDWLQKLVNESLEYAGKQRDQQDWTAAWSIYGRLAGIFEREALYEKLERDAVTHLRLEASFKAGSNWKERLERVRWEDAEEALKHVDALYVEPADFKKMAERGLEQLLLLVESKSAQEAVDGLGNADNRADFENRIKERLAQVRAAPTLDAERCAELFRRVVRDINRQTVQLPESLIVSELMRGAFEPLDDFTTIIWPKEIEEFDKHTRGNFIGVGIQIIKNRANEIEVQTPLDDTPAYRAGIQAGDVIAAVNGEKLGQDISLNKVVEIITGPKDTPVTLTIRRDGKELDFPLVRAEVKIQSVKGVKRREDAPERWSHWLDKDNGIAYVRVTNFQKNSVEDVDNGLRELQGNGLKGVVLDLRGNPGGLLDSAWQMSSLFLKKGEEVVSTRGRIEEENHRFVAPADGPYANLPLVVLVDENSASASEIVSGAIRDHRRGIVVGDRTFGKFSVQNLVPLSHSRAKLKITTASYYLPSGVSLHRKAGATEWGVAPTITNRLRRWEQVNLWQMRRDADLLGPAAAKPKKEEDEGAEAPEEEFFGPEVEFAELSDWVGPPAPPKLPPLKQPDENKRPKEDAQLDTALLVLRATVLGNSRPTVAAAEKAQASQSVRP